MQKRKNQDCRYNRQRWWLYKKNSNACVLIPVVNSKHITPHSEGMQAVIWHMIVSHPKLKVNKTKWESLK